MGQQVMRQPDGRLAVFDTTVDRFVVTDAERGELVDWFAERAAADARERARLVIEVVAAGGRYYPQPFAMTWEQAAALDQAHKG